MLLVFNVNQSICTPFEIKEHLLKYNEGMLLIVRMVTEDRNPQYYRLIKKFEEKLGCGVIVNTSFNARGETIVCTQEDAYLCFMRTEMDVRVINNCIMMKENTNWKEYKSTECIIQYYPDTVNDYRKLFSNIEKAEYLKPLIVSIMKNKAMSQKKNNELQTNGAEEMIPEYRCNFWE